MSSPIILSSGKVAIVDDADLGWLSEWKWSASFNGTTWYALRREGVSPIYMHRAILGLGRGRVPEVDHRNNDGLDNQRDNLRLATRGQNTTNTRTRSASGFRGVTLMKARAHMKRPWIAQIRANNVYEHLGYFATPEEAARAYDTAARERHGEFARLNF